MKTKRTQRSHRPTPLGLALKFYREAADLTQPELDHLAEVSGVGMIESGARPNAYTSTLEKLARALTEKLGYAVTPNDLRAGPPPQIPEAAERALDELLASPVAAGAGPDIVAALRRFKWPPGFVPDATAWNMILTGLRMARRDTQ